MFLGDLNQVEKEAFLEIAHFIARSDKDFSDKQKQIISTYCFEMQIDDIDYDEKKFNLQETLKKFETAKSKKILLLEIMALIYSDSIIHEEEQKIINDILDFFGFSHTVANLYMEWTKTILSVTEQGKLLIEI